MPKVPQYTKEQVEKALEDISQGLSVRTAAKKYGVPRATLQFKLKHPEIKSTYGPDPYLTREEEKQLEDWLCEMGRRGFPRNAEDVLDSVQNFLNKNPRQTPFNENRPGKGWLKGFLKRHPRITVRTGEAVTQASACVSESDIRNWFGQVMDQLNKSDLTHILDDPSRIFNAVESGFQTCPSTGKVFAEKEEKNVYIVDKGKAKESMTVLFTISADGRMVLPTIVYPYQRLPERIRQTVPDDWGVATSSSGWMTADTFKYIIEHVFHPFLVKNNVQFPVLLFVDGHKSHLTYDLSVLAHSLQIEIFALYPNATRILQPADVSLFRPVKQFWKTAVREWLLENIGEIVSKQNFALVLKKVTDKISSACIVNGFRACGLYPFNPNAVDYSKCIAKPTSTPENIADISKNEPDKTLPFSKFKEIVGAEMINKFKDIKNVIQDVQNNESFFTLYQIWDFYNSKPSASENSTENTNESREGDGKEIEPATTNFTNNIQREDINTIIINDFFENEENQNITSNDMPEFAEIYQERQESTIEQQQSLEQGTRYEQNSNLNDQQTCEHVNKKLIISSYCDAEYRSSYSPSDFEPTKTTDDVQNEELITLEDLGIANVRDLSLDQPSCSKTVLKDFLPIPSAPARKGKRNIERLPYHISGPEYQKILEDKNKEKQRLEEEKKAKKIQREIKKAERMRRLAEAKTKKLDKKMKLQLNSCCGVCKRVTKNIKLRCCECGNAFHKVCIPKSHLIHIPQEEGDNFLCHICFCMENDDSNDENGESESDQENEDFFNTLRAGQEELGVNYVKFK